MLPYIWHHYLYLSIGIAGYDLDYYLGLCLCVEGGFDGVSMVAKVKPTFHPRMVRKLSETSLMFGRILAVKI